MLYTFVPNVILQKPFIEFKDAQITKSNISECKKEENLF